MYFHVRIEQKSQKSTDETRVDMTDEQLRERILHPYELGEPIIINGKTIPPSDINRVRIGKSEQPSQVLIEQIKDEDRRSSVVVLGGPSYEWQAADKADDITDNSYHGSTRVPAGRWATEQGRRPCGTGGRFEEESIRCTWP